MKELSPNSLLPSSPSSIPPHPVNRNHHLSIMLSCLFLFLEAKLKPPATPNTCLALSTLHSSPKPPLDTVSFKQTPHPSFSSAVVTREKCYHTPTGPRCSRAFEAREGCKPGPTGRPHCTRLFEARAMCRPGPQKPHCGRALDEREMCRFRKGPHCPA